MRLKDKIAVVTGSGSGIGRATAEAFAREGAAVVVVDIDVDGGETTVAGIAEAGGTASFFQADCSKRDEIEAMVGFACSEFGRLDILHNNHFVLVPGRTGDVAYEAWQRALDVNLTGYWYAIRTALGPMTSQGSGAILNTASIAGLTADYGLAAYSAVKAGVVNLTRVTAIEYAREGVRCNAVCPGPIHTRPGATLPSQFADIIHRRVPMDRSGLPHEVANAALFLVSDEASFITGATLTVDGGMYAAAGLFGPEAEGLFAARKQPAAD